MEILLKDQETGNDKSQVRKSLIPFWIKIFGWLFIVMGGIVPFLYIGSLIFGFSASYTMFGLEYEGNAKALMPLVISTVILINGLCAYGLLFGKDWGLTACIVFGYIGLLLTLGNVFFDMIFNGGMMIRLDPVIQIPYLVKLHRIKTHW
ncbi:MAG: hypothetical protein K2W88_10155 [Pararheinheimera sp.]|nr:hypothetical protein [Rheinheimera sp.]